MKARERKSTFLIGEEKHRDKRDNRVRDGGDNRAAYFRRALVDILEMTLAGMALAILR